MYSIPISVIIGISAGIVYGLITFSSFGILIGLIGFKYFKENEYYTYQNLGYSKINLIKNVFIRNAIITFLLLVISLVV